MPTLHFDNFCDPRLDAYRSMKDRDLAAVGDGTLFLAEGRLVVERLLASKLDVESVLIERRRLEEMAPVVGERAPLYVVPNAVMEQVTGYKIHTGVLAVGRRPERLTVDAAMRSGTGDGERGRALFCSEDSAKKSPSLDACGTLWLVAPVIKELANLGALVRTAAAFGVTGLLLGPHCCDPYYRRAVRVSMGTVFRLPVVQSDDLQRDLLTLRDGWGVELCATVLDEGAELLHEASPSPRMAILMGHEYLGLDEHWVKLCQRKVTIPMHLGTDSLNVSVAAALLCYHFLAPTKPIRLPEAGN